MITVAKAVAMGLEQAGLEQAGWEPGGNTGLVIIRMWLEPGTAPDKQIRARITSTNDLEAAAADETAAATVDEILKVVRTRLETFVSAHTATLP